MDNLSENLEFIREFALESRDILDELNQLTDALGQMAAGTRDIDHDILDNALQNLQAMQGSAEFLGIDPIFRVTHALADCMDTCRQLNSLSRDVPGLYAKSLACLDDFLNQLAEKGRIQDADDKLDILLPQITGESQETIEEEPEPEVFSPVEPDDDLEFEDFEITITPAMLNTFVMEAIEQLEIAENSLLGLEKSLEDKELLDHAFRAVHTLKGNCGLFNYAELEKLGHHFESILEDFKAGKYRIDRKIITALLQVLDVIKATIDHLPDGGGSVQDLDHYLHLLTQCQAKGHVGNLVGKSEHSLLGEILVEAGFIEQEVLEMALSKQARPIGEILLEMNLIDDGQLGQALEIQKEWRRSRTDSKTRRSSVNRHIRVDLFKLDGLMNLVGELIIAENMVTNNPDLEGHVFENFKKAALDLNRISRELQDIAMSLRMIPIEATFTKMIRAVRDLSQKQGKLVEMETHGGDTEVDKNVVEQIAGPLLHLIRNAIDHGIEPPEQREREGKTKIAKIQLKAFHEGGEVVIEVHDDGRGIDAERVLAKAREKGLVGTNDHLDARSIINLIFEPGFSTAEQVTDISGRGVGMDVVRKNIELIKGRVFVDTALGQGTTFSIRIPLTLAIIEGMLVRVGEQLFTIPLLSIRESLHASTDALANMVDGSEMVKIRDVLLPVLRIHQLFGIESDYEALTDGILIVVDDKDERICMFVDEILGQYQTVIKGLDAFFGTVKGISGTSILSNGDISLILDIPGLIAHARRKSAEKSGVTAEGLYE